jgi:hypothetical protein
VAEDQKGKQAVKAYSRDDHYIDSCYRISMIAKKRPPALLRRAAPAIVLEQIPVDFMHSLRA